MLDKFFASIGHNLARIADISGRESNILFWPYAILVAALNYVAGHLVAAPVFNAMLQQMLRVFAEGGRPSRPVEPFELMPDMSGLVVPHAIILAVTVILLFSAVARRLHDRDRTGLWGLMPLPFAILALALMPHAFAIFSGGEPDMSFFLGLMLNNLVYLAALLVLIVLLAGKGDKGPNRFGPAPE